MSYEQTIKELFNYISSKHPDLLSGIDHKIPSTEQTSISFLGDFNGEIGKKIQESFLESLKIQHKLPDWIINMTGMSGKKYRYFINNLIGSINDPKYLEVGSWSGSTACSAMWGNSLSAICIDNWSLFGGPKDLFLDNIKNVSQHSNCKFSFVEEDFRSVNFELLDYRANIYLFDGPHEEQDQYDGIVCAMPSLENDFVLIVDDYNWSPVRNGTIRAINDLGLKIVCGIQVLTTTNGSHPIISGPNSDWHNGYFIALISQNRKPGTER